MIATEDGERVFTWFYWFVGRLTLLYFAIVPVHLINVKTVQKHFQFYHVRGLDDIAFRIVDLMTDREPNEARYYYLRAIMFCENSQFEDGFEDVSAALDIAPREEDYWIFRARIYKYLDRYEEAISDLRQSILYSRDGQSSIQLFEIGMNYMNLTRFEDALQAFEESVKNEQVALPLYYYRLAQAHDRLMNREQAKQYLRQCIEMNFQIEEDILGNRETVYDRSKYTGNEITGILVEVYELCLYVPTLCRFYFAEDKNDEALALIDRALQVLPNHQTLFIERGKCLRRLRRYDEAMVAFNTALESDDSSAEIFVERAHVFRLLGDEDAALHDFLKAKQLDDQFPYLHYWIAGSYVALDQMEDALHMFGQALKDDEQDFDCHLERAEVYESLGMFAEAERDYDDAVRLHDHDETRMKRALFYMRRNRPDEALIELQKALDCNGDLLDNNEFRYVRAILFMDIDNYELAEIDLRRAIELDSDSELLYERLARCLANLGRMDEALDNCNRGLSLNPDFVPLLWARGFLLFQLGDYLGASRDALDYLRLNPEDASAHFNLALIYVHLYEYKNALAQFSLAIARDPYHVEAYYQRAHVWEKLLDFDRVAQDLANWVFYDRTDFTFEKRVEKLQELDTFDELIIDDAVVQLKKLYGQNGPSLLH